MPGPQSCPIPAENLATFSLCPGQAVAWFLVTVFSQIYREKEQQGKKSVQSGEERRGAGSKLGQI